MILARAGLLVLSLSVIVEEQELIIVDTVVCGCKLQRSTVDDGEVVSCFGVALVRARSADVCAWVGVEVRMGGLHPTFPLGSEWKELFGLGGV